MAESPSQDALSRRLERERRARREAEAIAEDVTRELYDTIGQLRATKAVLDETTDYVAITDLEGRPSYINRALREALGPAGEDLATASVFDLLTPASRQRLMNEALPVVLEKGVWRGELAIVMPGSGSEVPVSQVLIGHRAADGVIDSVSSISRDITDRIEAEQRLAQLALHDPLTGLANRRLFFDRLDIALARASRVATSVGVFYIDLDGFKPINDRHGHDVGDQVLTTVAHRLVACLRPNDTVARLGGDEFVTLCEHVRDAPNARLIADRIAEAIEQPIPVSGREVSVTASVGIVLTRSSPPGGPDDLIRQADSAMYHAKQRGKARHHLYGDSDPAR